MSVGVRSSEVCTLGQGIHRRRFWRGWDHRSSLECSGMVFGQDSYGNWDSRRRPGPGPSLDCSGMVSSQNHAETEIPGVGRDYSSRSQGSLELSCLWSCTQWARALGEAYDQVIFQISLLSYPNINTSGIISGTQLVLLWNWSLQLETSLGSQSLSAMRIWTLRKRKFGSFVTEKQFNDIQVEDDQICQGGRLKGIFLRGERATGIEPPCSMGLIGGRSQGMSSSSGRQMRGCDLSRENKD